MIINKYWYLILITADYDELTGQSFEKLQRSCALFLLKMKDKHKISQTAIDDIVHHSQDLIDNVVSRVKAGIFSKLAAAGIDLADVPGIQDVWCFHSTTGSVSGYRHLLQTGNLL